MTDIQETDLAKVDGITIAEAIAACHERAERWHGDKPWTTDEWMTAIIGELGEAANFMKKLNRIRDGLSGQKPEMELNYRKSVLVELADVLAYIFCLIPAVMRLSEDGEARDDAVIFQAIFAAKFNKISERYGFDEKLGFTLGFSIEEHPDDPKVALLAWSGDDFMKEVGNVILKKGEDE